MVIEPMPACITQFCIYFAFAASGCAACTPSNPAAPEPSTRKVPAALLDIEGTAEDAYDQALVANYPAVTDDATTIDTQWKAFRDQALADGAKTEWMSAMDDAVAELLVATQMPTDSTVVARAANAISAPMDELFGLYDVVVPVDVLALDYLGREVVLDAREADFVAAGRDVDVIESTFAGISGALIEAGGTTVADDYTASIESQRSAIAAEDPQRLEAEANVGLELVDDMEGVFEGAG